MAKCMKDPKGGNKDWAKDDEKASKKGKVTVTEMGPKGVEREVKEDNRKAKKQK